jgi:hypothetical protein
MTTEARDRYVSLLRDTLTMSIWDGADGTLPGPAKFKEEQSERRAEGLDWPALAFSMIGAKRMANLQFCVEDVLRRGVPGDFIETGVWRGGACIFIRGILAAYGVTDRSVWVADSFRGLPTPSPDLYPADAGAGFHLFDALAVDADSVRAAFDQFGLLDDQVKFLEGWFKDTLPTAPIEQLAVARLDGDLYESTMDALVELYPKVSVGGYVIIDDYALPMCSSAVHDYRREHGIKDRIEVIDWTGVFWQKSG